MNQRLAVTLAFLMLGACSMKSLRSETSETPKSAETTAAPAAEDANDSLEPSAAKVAELSAKTMANKTPPMQVPHTMLATKSGDVDTTGDMEIKLKDKNGKVVSGKPMSSNIHIEDPATIPAASSTVAENEPYEVDPEAGTPPAVDPTPPESVPLAKVRQPGAVPADKALNWLKNGNRRFTKGFLRKDGQSKADIKRLITVQNPHSVILSCSDSRTPPELVFDQKLGEVSVVRTLGPNLDQSVIASIEYAVQQNGANLVVVMGHNRCDTVKAAISAHNHPPSKSPDYDKTIAAMHPRLAAFNRTPAATTPSADLSKEAWANVEGVAAELIKRSVIIREAIEAGTLKVSEAVYDIDHGNVNFSKEPEAKKTR